MKALLVDFGGVLTTNVFASFRAFCKREGLDPQALIELLRSRPEAREALRAVETGRISEGEFEATLGGLLGLERTEGLIDRLLGDLAPDGEMVAAVRRAKAAGVRTGLISNSLGAGRYDRSVFPELFHAVVISGEEGMHKPQPEIYLLAAERVGVEARACVFVDDLRENCAGAEAVGMTAILHRGAGETIPELERLLDVELR